MSHLGGKDAELQAWQLVWQLHVTDRGPSRIPVAGGRKSTNPSLSIHHHRITIWTSTDCQLLHCDMFPSFYNAR